MTALYSNSEQSAPHDKLDLTSAGGSKASACRFGLHKRKELLCIAPLGAGRPDLFPYPPSSALYDT